MPIAIGAAAGAAALDEVRLRLRRVRNRVAALRARSRCRFRRRSRRTSPARAARCRRRRRTECRTAAGRSRDAERPRAADEVDERVGLRIDRRAGDLLVPPVVRRKQAPAAKIVIELDGGRRRNVAGRRGRRRRRRRRRSGWTGWCFRRRARSITAAAITSDVRSSHRMHASQCNGMSQRLASMIVAVFGRPDAARPRRHRCDRCNDGDAGDHAGGHQQPDHDQHHRVAAVGSAA